MLPIACSLPHEPYHMPPLSTNDYHIKLHDESSKVANSENKNTQEKKSETSSLGMISEKYSSQKPAFIENHMPPSNIAYDPGDRFDVYVDGGRFLPENATISRVTVIAFSHSTGALLRPFILKSGNEE
ncbi:hypothetical protein AAMO2058_001684000, partial [Amorphochlora amoebiformis]